MRGNFTRNSCKIREKKSRNSIEKTQNSCLFWSKFTRVKHVYLTRVILVFPEPVTLLNRILLAHFLPSIRSGCRSFRYCNGVVPKRSEKKDGCCSLISSRNSYWFSWFLHTYMSILLFIFLGLRRVTKVSERRTKSAHSILGYTLLAFRRILESLFKNNFSEFDLTYSLIKCFVLWMVCVLIFIFFYGSFEI